MAYEDLLKDTSESFEDGNYFLVTITELDLATQYPLQFRWKYKDGTYGKDWSGVYYVTTPGATVPLEPNLDASDVVGGAGFISVTWNGKDASNNNIENIDRVDIYISGTSFPDGSKPAGNFKESGTQTFTAEPGIYIVQLKAVRVNGTTSFFSSARTVTVTEVGEPNDPPVAPTGFSARAILGGIELTWNGTYSGGAAWSGFQAVNIYAGTSAVATSGTYIKVGQMTANKTTNKIVIPIDGTYVKYGSTAYIHASSINKATPPAESSISANVANATPSQIVNTDLIDSVITAAKIALGAVTEVKIDNAAITEAKIATSAITETKIATDAVTSPKIIAGAITAGKIATGAITADKIEANAITADKIAANSITAGKIVAGEITADKLAALTITGDKIAANAISAGKVAANAVTVDLLGAGSIAATTYIRAGTAGGGRIDISASASSGVTAGLYIYNSGGTAVFEAPLGGGVTVTGHLKATQISTTSGDFTVSTSGILTAKSADIDGTIKATAGYIGGTTSGIYIANGAIQNDSSGSQFKLDNTGKARFGSSSGNAIIIDPTAGNGGYYIYHTTGGQSGNSSGIFSVSTSGNLTSTSGSIGGWTIGSTTLSSGLTTLNSNGTISGASITGSSINITGETFSSANNDTDGTSGTNTGQSNAFTSSYVRNSITNLGINGISLMSANTAGVISSWYPYFDGSVDLGIKAGATYNTYRWRNLRLTGDAYLGGDGSTNAVGPTEDANGTGAKIKIYSDGRIYANTLGVASGTTLVQSSGGYIRVSSSSKRYKDNIIEINKSGYLNLVSQLKPVTFNYKQEFAPDDYENEIAGLIAEDLDQIEEFRTVVNYNSEGLPESISYDRMSSLLILAIKEIKDKLESIEQRLDALEG
jgi:hypothetical protein